MANKIIKTICKTKRCRLDSKGRQFCSTCRSRKAREADPIKSAYTNKKSNAKRDGIPFTISLEYFRTFAIRVDLIKNRGRRFDSYTIDRKINELGYIEGNIQILPNAINAQKGRKRILSYDWLTNTAVYY